MLRGSSNSKSVGLPRCSVAAVDSGRTGLDHRRREAVHPKGRKAMRIVVANLPNDVSEEGIRGALSPFAPVDKIKLVKESGTPSAVIEAVEPRVRSRSRYQDKLEGCICKSIAHLRAIGRERLEPILLTRAAWN